MRITKLEHAALIVEEAGSRLVIDPGGYSRSLAGVTDVAAVVITHEHADHWTPDQLAAIRETNPGVPVYSTRAVADAASEFDVVAVAAGDEVAAGPFALRFFGSTHNVIHSSIPVVSNVGVLVNGRFFYGGDSYEVPDAEIEVLAAPSSAPWLKIGEAMDFVLAVAPRRAFATHEAINSEIGQGMAHARLKWAVEQGGGEYTALAPGETLEV